MQELLNNGLNVVLTIWSIYVAILGGATFSSVFGSVFCKSSLELASVLDKVFETTMKVEQILVAVTHGLLTALVLMRLLAM